MVMAAFFYASETCCNYRCTFITLSKNIVSNESFTFFGQ